jgi:uncharacterized protein YbbC (DUF1343 family)
MKKYSLLILTALMALNGCKTKSIATQENVQPEPEKELKLGIEVLEHTNFKLLQDKRVGLVTNPTGVDSKLNSTVDILFKNPGVNLVALFGPEHGVRGNFSAGDHVGNQTDPQTGIPVFSLYGKDKKPNKEAMEMVDVIVYDIQDIGVRSYTYISTMGLVMEAAADFDKEVVILDRPNPLGGNRVEGPLVEEGYFSFVSQFKIPYVYGLTCGELALMMNEEGLLNEAKKCKLQVVKMEGWRRDMTYDKTRLLWVPTSPHIPQYETSFYYAATGIIGEIDPNLIGIGYTLPFQTLATENINANQLTNAMNALNMEGVIFRPIYFKPYYQNKKGEELQGVQIHITDYQKVNLTEIQFYFLQEAHKIDPTFDIFEDKENRYRMFDFGCGSDKVRTSMMEDYNFEKLKPFWRKDNEAFKALSSQYYLYK